MELRKGWTLSVLEACIRQADSLKKLCNQDLIKNQLPIIVRETQSLGKTPDRTMSRVLQLLRDLGLVEFRGRGNYKLLKAKVETIKDKKLSREEKLISELLTELKIPFIREKTFSDLKHKSFLRLDFYFQISSRIFVVEYDGEQHRHPVPFFGGEIALMDLKLRDAIKDKYCKKKNMTLIRVSSLEEVEELKSKLTKTKK